MEQREGRLEVFGEYGEANGPTQEPTGHDGSQRTADERKRRPDMKYSGREELGNGNSTFVSTLRGLEIGAGISHESLILNPLFGGFENTEEDFDFGLDLLEDALGAGTLLIAETDESGSVPELRAMNSGSRAVLILEGDELLGLKQNRTVNSSVLLKAGTSVILPVSCVERGRWSRSSRASGSTSISHLALRRLKTRSVHASLRAHRGYESDQTAVWNEVDRKSGRHGHTSKTSALHDARLSLKTRLDDFQKLVEGLPEDALGVVVSIGGKPVAMELLPNAGIFRKAAPRLVCSYALEALEHDPHETGDRPETARDLLLRLAGADPEEHAALGAGRELRFEVEDLQIENSFLGYALVDGERVIHAAAFTG